MPKIVDHEERRQQIIDAFLTLVERGRGLDAASSRALAAQLGVSNSLLWRYFDDMDAIVERAYREVVARTNARIERGIAGRRGLDAVHALIDELMPVTSVSQAEARIVVAYWAAKVRDRRSYVEPHNCWRVKLVDFLEQACELGEVADDCPVQVLADAVVDIVDNAQVEFAMSEDEHTALAARDLARAIVRLH
ncbi:TetR/AcrR family transcriptional regulator [Bifidobacterium sp. AGR2158]|uniref:TetR/AcrR family transcriptional regulator n=1 Tax=Bifidobacterium sp. AGR2158 TaxID=1280675 RepID=UPI00042A91A7|nr:TetR/AcrR family transcriptional regulator [Bifidobacterium sp. AGR2158]